MTLRRVSSSSRLLLWCQSGYEDLLAAEVHAAGWMANERGGNWILAQPPADENARTVLSEPDWCFAHGMLLDAQELSAGSVNALAAVLAEFFLSSARGERFEQAWPLRVTHASGQDGLGRRAAAVEGALRDQLQRKMARVVKLATAEPPRVGRARGLFIHLVDFGRALVSREAWFGGQRRMADDPAAPSRSYLKVEEAYGVLGCEPTTGEVVVDLGAAPGGWSFSAARRGARVIAVDNGPLKAGALHHPGIEHRREDAFRFRPAAGQAIDWLFCDLVEEPHHVLRAIVVPWLDARWCRCFVVNLKFGRADPLALLREVRQTLAPHSSGGFAVRHLFHDRDEFTIVGRR